MTDIIPFYSFCSGKPPSSARYRKEVILGYTLPISISFLTFLAEVSLSRCGWAKPRFGEEGCFFAGEPTMQCMLCDVSCFNSFLDKISKFVWFYIPIITMLAVNLFMFTRVVKKLSEMDREKRRVNLRQPDQRNDKMEKLAMTFVDSRFLGSC
jgi:hypothetical protein